MALPLKLEYTLNAKLAKPVPVALRTRENLPRLPSTSPQSFNHSSKNHKKKCVSKITLPRLN